MRFWSCLGQALRSGTSSLVGGSSLGLTDQSLWKKSPWTHKSGFGMAPSFVDLPKNKVGEGRDWHCPKKKKIKNHVLHLKTRVVSRESSTGKLDSKTCERGQVASGAT